MEQLKVGSEHYTRGNREKVSGNIKGASRQYVLFLAFCFSQGCSYSKVHLAVIDDNNARGYSEMLKLEELTSGIKKGTALSLLPISQGCCEDQRREWL